LTSAQASLKDVNSRQKTLGIPVRSYTHEVVTQKRSFNDLYRCFTYIEYLPDGFDAPVPTFPFGIFSLSFSARHQITRAEDVNNTHKLIRRHESNVIIQVIDHNTCSLHEGFSNQTFVQCGSSPSRS
jgi:hypothetical protein